MSQNSSDLYFKLPVFMQNIACTIYGIQEGRKRYGGRFTEFSRWVNESQNWSLDKLLDYQNRQVARIVKRAYNEVPFWNERFRKLGLSPDDIKSVDDLKKLPVLSKEEVFQAGDTIVNPKFDKNNLIKMKTSGSTGTPLELYHTYDCLQMQRALWWRHRGWYGIERGCHEAGFGGNVVVPFTQTRPPFWRHIWFDKRVVFSQYHLKSNYIKYYIQYLNNNQFDCYSGYPSVLYQIADYLEQSGERIHRRPQVVFAGAENIEDFQRVLIEEHIAPVTSHYGGAEYAGLASRCPAGYYHIDLECGVIEIIPLDGFRNNGRKITGRVVVTGFWNDAMPFIRYDMNDLATLLPDFECPCGRERPVLERIEGRSDSYLVTADGGKIGNVNIQLRGHYWVREVQIIQEEIYRITIKVVLRSHPQEEEVKKFIQIFKNILGEKTEVNVNFVEKIERTNAGKYRLIVSKIAK